jgi:hypothetical protein
LILLPGLWVALIIIAFTLIYWGTGLEPFHEAFIVSGSSLLTLGFDRPPGLPHIVLSFVEAALGLGVVALMISYLPTFYNAFNRREALVGMLEARAGDPPSASVWLARYHIIGLLPPPAELKAFLADRAAEGRGIQNLLAWGVTLAVAIGILSRHWNSRLLASVSLALVVGQFRVLQHAGQHLARYELPAELRIVDELPRTSSAKVDLSAVRAGAAFR